MHAVILAAGKSTRTYPLTLTRPKPLLQLAGTTILGHTLEQLEGLVDEVILVVGWKKEMIEEFVDSRRYPFPIRLVEQKEQKGTGHALQQARPFLKDTFLVLTGDDIFFREDLKAMLKYDYAILGAEVPDPQNYGVISQKNSTLRSIDEKPKSPKSSLVNTGCFTLQPDVFSISLKPSERGELEATDYMTACAKTKRVSVVTAKNWFPIGYPWHLLEANEFLLKKLAASKKLVQGTVEKGATLKGAVSVGKGTVIRAGSYIEGPVVIGDSCIIGPNCHIRPCTSIGNKCVFGNAVEIKNSIIFDDSCAKHLAFIGDSILGEDVNIGGGTVTASWRHDNQPVQSMVKGALVSTGRRKFGTVIGDSCRIGANTTILPGRKLWPGKTTRPGEVVEKDVE